MNQSGVSYVDTTGDDSVLVSTNDSGVVEPAYEDAAAAATPATAAAKCVSIPLPGLSEYEIVPAGGASGLFEDVEESCCHHMRKDADFTDRCTTSLASTTCTGFADDITSLHSTRSSTLTTPRLSTPRLESIAPCFEWSGAVGAADLPSPSSTLASPQGESLACPTAPQGESDITNVSFPLSVRKVASMRRAALRISTVGVFTAGRRARRQNVEDQNDVSLPSRSLGEEAAAARRKVLLRANAALAADAARDAQGPPPAGPDGPLTLRGAFCHSDAESGASPRPVGRQDVPLPPSPPSPESRWPGAEFYDSINTATTWNFFKTSADFEESPATTSSSTASEMRTSSLPSLGEERQQELTCRQKRRLRVMASTARSLRKAAEKVRPLNEGSCESTRCQMPNAPRSASRSRSSSPSTSVPSRITWAVSTVVSFVTMHTNRSDLVGTASEDEASEFGAVSSVPTATSTAIPEGGIDENDKSGDKSNGESNHDVGPIACPALTSHVGEGRGRFRSGVSGRARRNPIAAPRLCAVGNEKERSYCEKSKSACDAEEDDAFPEEGEAMSYLNSIGGDAFDYVASAATSAYAALETGGVYLQRSTSAIWEGDEEGISENEWFCAFDSDDEAGNLRRQEEFERAQATRDRSLPAPEKANAAQYHMNPIDSRKVQKRNKLAKRIPNTGGNDDVGNAVAMSKGSKSPSPVPPAVLAEAADTVAAKFDDAQRVITHGTTTAGEASAAVCAPAAAAAPPYQGDTPEAVHQEQQHGPL
eukprot:TRINITY_DN50719_c0_g1_i1.p1 TRINITY_DN50719_c0_g1~~TRINITY_DN50719_c0_g1_i1.p1  ORF type:complete len:764 (+),score=142.22 TRINITY_DN50719_c0_g1_i1:58-2349(+)